MSPHGGDAKGPWGFTPQPRCENCGGDGVFSENEYGHPTEPCIFCLEDAIKRGELDGHVDGTDYVGGEALREYQI